MADRPHSDFIRLCEAIGYVVIFTALIEQQFDALVNVVFNALAGAYLEGSREVPHSLSRKIRFLKKAFGELPHLQPYASEGRRILLKAEPLFKRRNDLVHGAITAQEPVNGAFHFRLIGHDKADHTLRKFTFHHQESAILQTELPALLEEVLALMNKLRGAALTRQE